MVQGVNFEALAEEYSGVDAVQQCQMQLDQLAEKIAHFTKVLTAMEILGWVAFGLSVIVLACILWQDRRTDL